MSARPTLTRYPDSATLCTDLAARLGALLAAGVAARGQASLVVSGGRSPLALFERLRHLTIDWRRVAIALADERWVEPGDAASNERLVRGELLRDAAAAASFTGLKNTAETPALGAAAAWKAYAGLARPFDVMVLGMGEDGHTASLFPGSPNLTAGLDPDAAAGCIGMTAPSPPEARLSLNLAALVDSRRIVILIAGESKWHTYMAATRSGTVEEMPVRAVLRQQRTPVEVVWSP